MQYFGGKIFTKHKNKNSDMSQNKQQSKTNLDKCIYMYASHIQYVFDYWNQR